MWKNYSFLAQLKQFLTRQPAYQAKEQRIQGTTYCLRLMKAEDIKAVLAIERDVYAGEVPWGYTAFLMEMQTLHPHRYLVVEAAGQLVAFIGVRVAGTDAHITNLAVHSAYQRRGLGTLLLKEAEQFARSCQCEQLSLEVKMSNLTAQSLYRRYGFISERIKKNYYTEQQEDALVMCFLLT